MGFFERRRKGSAPLAPDASGTVTVPPGHEVATHCASAVPVVSRSAGGVFVAQLGLGSDEMREELDQVLRELDALARGPRPTVILSAAGGLIDSLFAPANPQIVEQRGVLAWALDPAALAGAPDAEVLAQRLLCRMFELAGAGIHQTIYLLGDASPRGDALTSLFRGLGLDVRRPDPINAAILLEVHRPEGVILSALAGAPIRAESAPDPRARAVNAEKDRAEARGDRRARERLEEEERAWLAQRLGPIGGEPRVSSVHRATRLRRLLLAVADGGDAELAALQDELRAREIPLLVMVDPKTGGAALRSWPGGHVGLAAYPDEASFVRAAHDMSKEGSVGAASMTPRALFAWAASNARAVALNVYRAPDAPIYLPLSPREVRALATTARGGR